MPNNSNILNNREIFLAGGCFWGTEKYFENIQGVLSTDVGYANGATQNPSYEEICKGNTGFAETVHISYDPQLAPLTFLLEQYYKIINPTSVNRQGNDRGSQYRTGIYYIKDEDKAVIETSLKELSKQYDKPIKVECKPLEHYYLAEDYHQKYLDKNPEGYCHIAPSLFEEAMQAQPNQKLYQKPDKDKLKQELYPLQYEVTQNNATEPAFQNEFWNFFETGIYVDITTGEPLFVSTDKFESGCGWPSFSKPIDIHALKELVDNAYGWNRTEVRSRLGDSHLGHVFQDGPRESGGLRYCINSASLRFVAKSDMEAEGYKAYLPLVK